MPEPDFSDAALVLLGHGSTQNAESSAPVYQHAAELRRRRLFSEVREAFWKQDPKIKDVLESLGNRKVFIVPLFISEGYFANDVIPRELGLPLAGATRVEEGLRGGTEGSSEAARPANAGGDAAAHKRESSAAGPLPPAEPAAAWRYCRPVGTHEAMTEVILARAADVLAQFPFPRSPRPEATTLFIAGHGTGRNEDSRAAIDRQVDWIRARGVYAAVHGVFLEEEPRVGDCYEIARTRNLVVVPFFMSDGMHVSEDIPLLLGESKSAVQKRLANGRPAWHNPTERKGRLVWCAPAAGTDPRVAGVILKRVREIVE